MAYFRCGGGGSSDSGKAYSTSISGKLQDTTMNGVQIYLYLDGQVAGKTSADRDTGTFIFDGVYKAGTYIVKYYDDISGKYSENSVEVTVNDVYYGTDVYVELVSAKTGYVIFTSSQVWEVPAGVNEIDIFAVGGGGGGAAGSSIYYGGMGAGSGFVSNVLNKSIKDVDSLSIVIGSGGEAGLDGNTSFVSNGDSILCSADGGKRGQTMYWYSNISSLYGNGGSGGGFPAYYQRSSSTSISAQCAGPGGSNGSAGYYNSNISYSNNALATAANGSGVTTRAFKDSNNTLYAGAGGGGGFYNYYPSGAAGGSGGGGAGSSVGGSAAPGTPNTGGGGGGGAGGSGYTDGAAGGSGVVIIRWGGASASEAVIM